MIKGILFDFDGTLSYRQIGAYRMYQWILHQIDPNLDVHSLQFETLVQKCMLWDEYGTINKLHVLNKIKENGYPDLDVDSFKTIWYEKFHDFQQAMPRSYEVLEKLKKKYKLGMVTNGEVTPQALKIDILDMRKYFETVIISKDFGKDKPDPSIYLQAASDLGLKPEEIAFIGDTFATDITGAIQAGMKPIWYCYEHRGVSDWDILQVSSFDEIEQLFLKDTSWNQ